MMRLQSIRERAWRRAEAITNDVASPAKAWALQHRAEVAREPVTGDAPVIVSLTTHGARLASVHLAVESIARGVVRPRRIILWLDDPERFKSLPIALKRQVQRGLEVRLTTNFGPHTKYFPALGEAAAADLRLVTADDDVLYPRGWLARLVRASDRDPRHIACWRAHRIALNGREIAPYLSWRPSWSPAPSHRNFLTGVSGVIYPPRMIDALVSRGDSFRDCAPRADDVWLNYVAAAEDIRVAQVLRRPRMFALLAGTQASGLLHSNAFGAENDRQIALTYDQGAIDRVRVG